MPIKIFQSYSHHDWEPTPPYGLSRLQALSLRIRRELRTGDPRSEFRWMRDAEGVLRYGDRIEPTIQQAVAGCDIGLVILSRAYVASPYCRTEFDLLTESGKPVFVAQLEEVKSELERHEWGERAALIEESLFCRLFEDAPDGDGRETRFGPIPEHSEESARRFNEHVDALAEDVRLKGHQLLFNKDTRDVPGPAAVPFLPCDVLVLAPCPEPETHDAVKDLQNLLDQKDLTVQILTEDEVSPEQLEAHLSKTRVVAQVFGTMSGKKIGDVPMAEMQHRFAQTSGKFPKVWLTPTARGYDHLADGYREFVQTIEVDTRSLEEFASSLGRLVKADKEREAIIDRYEIPAGNALVVIDAHQEDWETGQRFQQRVQEAAQDMIDNFLVQFVQDGKENYRDTKKLLDAHKIHAVLMMYGPSAAGLTRFKERMPEYIKRVALQRQRQRTVLSALAIGDPCLPGAPPSPVGNAGGREIYRVMLENRATDADRTQAFIEHVCEIAQDVMPDENQAPAA